VNEGLDQYGDEFQRLRAYLATWKQQVLIHSGCPWRKNSQTAENSLKISIHRLTNISRTCASGCIYPKRILRQSFKGFRSETSRSQQDNHIWPPDHLLKLAILPDQLHSGTNYAWSNGRQCSSFFWRQLSILFLLFTPTHLTSITYKARKIQSGQLPGVASYLIWYSINIQGEKREIQIANILSITNPWRPPKKPTRPGLILWPVPIVKKRYRRLSRGINFNKIIESALVGCL